MKLYLFNTETRKKEEIRPLDGKTIRMYTCGPTIYNYAHIGNFRTYVFEDLLRRAIILFGFPILQVMNITDVDDKTIKGALSKNISLKEFTEPFKKAFFEDLQTLRIQKVEHYPEATQYIDQMIHIILNLIRKGVAYVGADESVYFSIQKFPQYGRLSHLQLSELKQGGSLRIATDEYEKEHASDFVLWKKYDPERDGNIYWESPFGKGRPGWHIECSAMALALLGETLDIHCGGVDNIFPHHENEIAQSESYTEKPFVAHWVHSEHLLVESKKMSKSLGNFFTLRDLLAKGYTGREIRYLLLQTHYRTQLNFTFESLDGAKASLLRLSDFILRLRDIQEEKPFERTLEQFLEEAKDRFLEGLGDDLNLSFSLAALFDLVRRVHSLCDEHKVGRAQAQIILQVLQEFDQVLGVLPLEDKSEELPKEVEEAIEKRQQARKEKKWVLADELRAFILSKGYVVEDTPQGVKVKKNLT